MYDDYAKNALMGASTEQSLGQYQPPTARRQLLQKKQALEGELYKVEAAIAALDSHPELEEFTETLKAGLR
jgi:hypothetical protein